MHNRDFALRKNNETSTLLHLSIEQIYDDFRVSTQCHSAQIVSRVGDDDDDDMYNVFVGSCLCEYMSGF